MSAFRFRLILILFFCVFLIFGGLNVYTPVYAANLEKDLNKQTAALSGPNGDPYLPATDPRQIIVLIIKDFLTFSGTAALVFIVYGGYLIMTSGGEEEKNTKGRRILVDGAIGMMIILSAFALTLLVIWLVDPCMMGKFTTIYNQKHEDFSSWSGIQPCQRQATHSKNAPASHTVNKLLGL